MSTISSITRLREQRHAVVNEMRAVIATADASGRDLTPAELTRVQALEARSLATEREISEAEERAPMKPTMRVGLEDHQPGHRGESRALFGEEVRSLLRDPNSSGGYTVGSEVASQVWESLRAESVVLESGVPVLRTSKEELTIPAVSGSAAVAWATEATAISETDMTFSGSIVRPTKLAAVLYVSNELIDDADADILALIEQDLAKSLALEVDRVFLEGSGAVAEPTGLLNTAGIGTRELGAGNGAAIAVDDVKDTLDAVREANGRTASIFLHEKTWSDLTSIKTGVASDKRYLLQNSLESPAAPFRPTVLGVPVFATTQINAARTVGSTNDCTNLYFVDNRHCAIVRREDLRVEVSRDVKFAEDMVAIKAVTRLGVAFPQPAAHYALRGVDLS